LVEEILSEIEHFFVSEELLGTVISKYKEAIELS